MTGLLVRGLLTTVVLAAVAASLVYLVAASTLHPRAVLEGHAPRPPQAVVDARLDRLNLDDHTPLARRYVVWASGVLRGDLGRTIDGDDVGGEALRRIGVSLRLVSAGALLGSVLGVLAGTAAAVRQHGLTDHLVTVTAFAVLTTPVFVLALLLRLGAQWLGHRAGVGLLPSTGEYAATGAPADRVRHLVLPTLTVALGRFAVCARYQRGVFLDVVHAGFVRTARAKGLRRGRALMRHGLRVGAVPAVTFSAYGTASVLAGAAITEKVFAWHGMGEWLIDSIRRADVNAVAAYGCFAALLVPATGLASDLVCALIDPRTRPAGRR